MIPLGWTVIEVFWTNTYALHSKQMLSFILSCKQIVFLTFSIGEFLSLGLSIKTTLPVKSRINSSYPHKPNTFPWVNCWLRTTFHSIGASIFLICLKSHFLYSISSLSSYEKSSSPHVAHTSILDSPWIGTCSHF